MSVSPSNSPRLELTISVAGFSQLPSSGARDLDINEKAEEEDDAQWMRMGGSTRKKLRLTKDQSLLLEESFRVNHTLNPKQKQELALQLNLRPRQVEVWFQNRRASF
ncbi:PREDICTED: homeobox-leucine zipper protein ATHB-X isoform X2 [Tarenaya hassleriana]|uniref:homeobox-leucine zipper protein ATHB-X isoform X2 n=1 Tax=Tarenaya hassleriana TaxID=28532 RepID=UPI00053C0F9B|nr:PREDICTED: homeobox-leucine zipper protein ATHB-X isoform X2 [Tarenaya hassleriana]